jgi:uncharacterized protein involved in oxidation of intracellular sulfur
LNILIIINDAPYASERAYSALRLATSLAAQDDAVVRLFFIGDGAWCAVKEQTVPLGAHDIEWMMRRFLAGAHAAGVCRTCMEARAIAEDQLIEGTHRSSLEELTAWTKDAEKVLVF